MEAVSIYLALDLCSGYTDSAYAIGCLTKWCHKWKFMGWFTRASGKTLANISLINDIVELLDLVNLSGTHVTMVPARDTPRYMVTIWQWTRQQRRKVTLPCTGQSSCSTPTYFFKKEEEECTRALPYKLILQLRGF